MWRASLLKVLVSELFRKSHSLGRPQKYGHSVTAIEPEFRRYYRYEFETIKET